MFENRIEELKEEIIEKTCELIKIPSVNSESIDKKKPFGEEINRALEYTLDLGKKLGFRTKNIDGYCGYIEFGEGEELVGIIGHLDVVPIGEGWIHNPFEAQIEDGKIYGRGAIDDKGPVIASLYAMKAVIDIAKVNKNVRLILGTNEERDWKCINYYKEHEKWPTIGFSPDADFPCIYAEKGIETIYFESKYNNQNEKIKIKNINCKNNAINVVPKYCMVELEINDTKILIKEVVNFIEKIKENKRLDVEIEIKNNKEIKLETKGVSAHAAHPDLGKNAISIMMQILKEVFENFEIDNDLVNFFDESIGMDFNGKKAKIYVKDESGELTLNVGDFSLENEVLKFGINLRIPVNTNFEYVEEKLEECIGNYKNLKMTIKAKQDSLYVDKNSYLVKTLCNIFNEVTGKNDDPIAIGGGTYARAFKNVISFGANMPGNKDMCHQVDEYIKIDDLLLASKIYAKAIYELAK